MNPSDGQLSPGHGWRGRAIRSAAWWAAIYPIMKVLQVGANVALAALLSPAIFGVMAIANAVMQGVYTISEIGMKPAVIRSRRGDDPKLLNTAWTLAVLRGLLVFLIVSALAYPVSSFYSAPELMLVLPVIGLAAIASGFRSTNEITCQRELREGRLAVIELCENIAGRTVMIGWAILAPGVLALAGGSLVGVLVGCVLTYVAIPGPRNRFLIERNAVRELLSFGVWILVGAVIAFFGRQVDRFIIPIIGGLDFLGVYAMAITIAYLPRELAALMASRIYFPLAAKAFRQSPEHLREASKRGKAIVLPLSSFAIFGMAMSSEYFFALLYDDRYVDAGWIAPLSGIIAWIGITNDFAGKTMLAQGAVRSLAASSLVRLLGCVGFGLLGGWLSGMFGFIIGLAVGAFVQHLRDSLVLRLLGIGSGREDLLYSGHLAVVWSVAFSVRYLWLPEFVPFEERAMLVDVGLFAVACLSYVPMFRRAARELGWAGSR